MMEKNRPDGPNLKTGVGAGVKDNDRKVLVEKGLAGPDQALKIKPDYVEALVYKGLLLRLQANGEKDAAKQAALIKQAEIVHDKAEEMRKQKVAGPAAAAPTKK